MALALALAPAVDTGSALAKELQWLNILEKGLLWAILLMVLKCLLVSSLTALHHFVLPIYQSFVFENI